MLPKYNNKKLSKKRLQEKLSLLEIPDDWKMDEMKKYDYTEPLEENKRHIKYFVDFYQYTKANSGENPLAIDQLFQQHHMPQGYTGPGRV